KVLEALVKLIDRNEVRRGKCRITLFDGSASKIWNGEGKDNVGILIQTAESGAAVNHLSLSVSPLPINSESPLAGVKSCNYTENLLAIENARSNGSDEAIRINQRGEITSACMANVFWIKDGRLFTPSLKTGCLSGTTREFVLEHADVSQVESGIGVLRDAEYVFLTSAGIGIVQIGRFENREFAGELHELTRMIEES
ncbi:MAG: aminotransferase class IV, partial [Acidobacteria bacterium]|nr:aminotransferase class IV [Acidobacteriota bacterium]